MLLQRYYTLSLFNNYLKNTQNALYVIAIL